MPVYKCDLIVKFPTFFFFIFSSLSLKKSEAEALLFWFAQTFAWEIGVKLRKYSEIKP